MIRHLLQGLLSLIFPPNCCVCKNMNMSVTDKDPLCRQCLARVSFNMPPFCVLCQRPSDGRLCMTCRIHPPDFDFAWSACVYDEPLKHLLLEFKYNHKTSLRRTFINLITQYINTHQLDIRQFDVLMPIPLFHARQRERGYNQALLIAQGIAQTYGIPVDKKTLVRRLPTPSQTRLSRKKRWTNIQGAFRIVEISSVKNKRILLVDDLLTTGATASEAAQTLKAGGAKLVGILTLATAGHEPD